MPQRTWGGSGSSGASSSSSSRSSSRSSSGSSWRSSSSSYDSDNGEPMRPEWAAFWVIALLVITVVPGFLNMISRSNDAKADQNATATTRALTKADLATIHAAIDPQIAIWKRTAKTDQPEWLNADDAGFSEGSNTRGVMYGYCDQNETFYVYILNISQPAKWGADVEGYAYTPNTNPSACAPRGWNQIEYVSAEESGWYFFAANSGVERFAMPTEFATLQNVPTALPTGVFSR